MIPELRARFNRSFTQENYANLMELLRQRCRSTIGFRVAETPIFMRSSLIREIAATGAQLTSWLVGNQSCLAAARAAIPAGYQVAGQTSHPNFVTADFALVREQSGKLAPRLVEIQAFPSLYGFQQVLTTCYRDAFALDNALSTFLGGIDESQYWALLRKTILGNHDPENVALIEIDPLHQKTRPDFEVTSARLGIPVVDIRSLEPVGDVLHYRDSHGTRVPIHRIYNRTIADELIARKVALTFDLTGQWNVEWAGHPNWYFLISKFALPWLSKAPEFQSVVPPAVFLDDFLNGPGRQHLVSAGVPLPADSSPHTVYPSLLLKPLFSFAGKGIQFDPTHAQLLAIPAAQRGDFLLQQRMRFEPTIDTPQGLTQAEIRILYLWPNNEALQPVLTLVRLGRGKMMGVDHNKNFEWVGASAAFFVEDEESKE